MRYIRPHEIMNLVYLSTKNYPSSSANHISVKRISESFSKLLNDRFFLVINNDTSNGELSGVTHIEQLRFGPHLRTIKFFFYFPFLYRKLKTKMSGSLTFMANDKFMLSILGFYRMFTHSFDICADFHTIKNFMLDGFVLYSCTQVICLTHHLRSYLEETYPRLMKKHKTIISPSAIDPTTFMIAVTQEDARTYAGIPRDAVVIGYFGHFKTMGMEKGLQNILEALSKLEEKYVLFAAGGDEKDIVHYKNVATDLGISHRVIFKGRSTQADLARFQKACDILAMPFPYNQHYAFFMSPIKMFEYMAAKRPIIASDLPSIREILNESNALLIPPNDVSALTNAITKIISDQEFAKHISEQAYKDCQLFTWDNKVEKIINFLERTATTHAL